MFDLLKKIFVLQFLFTISLISITCKKSPVQPDDFERFTFTFEDASCTEAWFNLKLNNLAKPVMVNIYKDNFLDKSFNIYETNDTTFYIENLLPRKNYEVYVEVQPANDKVYRSNKLRFTTMDTTSHEFTWQSWEFGTIGSSVLYDVAIIDENNIWAVGEINIADTSINGYTTYNAIHWDGTKWELKKIGGQGGWACRTVFAFSENDIWFEGNIHWNGSTYTAHMNGWPLMPNGDGWQVNKLWGSSSDDLYAVGNNGNIAHWDGRKWTKIESGTDLDILGIIPGYNQDEIYCYANDNSPFNNILIRIKDKKLREILTLPIINERIYGICRAGNFLFLEQGDKYYTKNLKVGDIFRERGRAGTWFTNEIVSSNINDIFIVGHNSVIIHYNGFNSKTIFFDYNYTGSILRGADVKDNFFVTVGEKSAGSFYFRGIVITGKRNK